jgi:hypothetical protein
MIEPFDKVMTESVDKVRGWRRWGRSAVVVAVVAMVVIVVVGGGGQTRLILSLSLSLSLSISLSLSPSPSLARSPSLSPPPPPPPKISEDTMLVLLAEIQILATGTAFIGSSSSNLGKLVFTVITMHCTHYTV